MMRKIYFHYKGQKEFSKVFKVPADDKSIIFLDLLNRFVLACNSKFEDDTLRSAELRLTSANCDVLPTTKICDTEATDVHVTRDNRCE